jgi:hypothetical protein
MKKIILDQNTINEIIRLYNEEMLGSPTISEKIGIHKTVIIRILKENGIDVGIPGRKFKGGKSESDKRYYKNNKDKISKYYSEWKENKKEYLKEYQKKWRDENRDKVRSTKRDYERTRKANDPLYKLISNFRTAIYQVLKENNVDKNGHYFEILKYSPDELISHLENQFKDGMTWDNYGEWHVDHIKAISLHNIKEIGDEEFMKCWSLDNLQPMWGKENIRKSNKIIVHQ